MNNSFTDMNEPTSYDLLVKRLAVESVSIPNVIDVFRELIPQSTDLIREKLPGLSSFWDNGNNQYRPKNKTFRLVLDQCSRFQYVAFQDTLVQVPEGFIGKPDNYAQELIKIGESVVKEGQKLLNDYVLVLSQFLSNKDARTSQMAHTALYNTITAKRSMYQRIIAGFFKSGSTLSRRPLGVLIDRFGDLSGWFREVERLDQVRTEQNFKLIEAKVKEAVELLDLINQRTTEQGIQQVSGESAKVIAKGAYEVAKFVEFMAIYNYQVESLVTSTNNTADQLASIFTDPSKD